jgi:hypothetical protein
MRRAVVAVAFAIALAGCSANAQPAAPSAALALPDGSTATPEQAAFWKAVEPNLSDDHRGDVAGVLAEARSICEINPSADWAIGVLKSAGYTLTEATAVNTAAHQQLCPQG